ncbi:MAG: hypothetical protein MZV64_73515 [Ignavibacteriales bacterium]|nr:hypothetical protein [Ignavibacteriales bacterium]
MAESDRLTLAFAQAAARARRRPGQLRRGHGGDRPERPPDRHSRRRSAVGRGPGRGGAHHGERRPARRAGRGWNGSAPGRRSRCSRR